MNNAVSLPRKLRRTVAHSPAALVVTYVHGDIDAHCSPRSSDVDSLLANFLQDDEIVQGVRRFDVYRFGALVRTVEG